MLQLNRTLSAHSGAVYALETGRTPGEFYSGGSDRIVSRWDLSADAPPAGLVNVGSIIYSMRYLPSFELLIIGLSSGLFHVVSLREQKELKLLSHHSDGIFEMVYSEKHQLLYLCSGDGSVSAWSVPDFEMQASIKLCDEKVRGISLDTDQNILAAACGDGSVRIFHADKLHLMHRLFAHNLSANCVCFHPDGNFLLSGGRDAMLRLWNTSNFEMIREIPAHNYAIYSISFSPDKKFFATGSRDKTVKIWNSTNAEFVFRADREKSGGHSHSVNRVLWTNYENTLLSAGDDRNILAWKIN